MHDDDSHALEGVKVINGLECKIACTSSKVSDSSVSPLFLDITVNSYRNLPVEITAAL